MENNNFMFLVDKFTIPHVVFGWFTLTKCILFCKLNLYLIVNRLIWSSLSLGHEFFFVFFTAVIKFFNSAVGLYLKKMTAFQHRKLKMHTNIYMFKN